jgi:hypothetical protein
MSKEVTYDHKEEKFIKISSTGYIDFDITLSLTSQEAKIFCVFPEKIETPSDCKEFLKPFTQEIQQMTFKTDQFKKANIYDYLRLSSNNATINSLLVVNRAFKKKAFVELITLSELRFKPENAFLREFVKIISEQNFLFLVENNFLPNLDSKIKFDIKIDNKIVKSFENICEPSGHQQQIDSSMMKKANSNSLENSLLFNLEKREEAKSAKKNMSPGPKSLKSGQKVTEKNASSRISGKSKGSNPIQNQNFNNNSSRNLNNLNNSISNKNINNLINNNDNSPINIHESSNIVFNNEEHFGTDAQQPHNSDLNVDKAMHDNKSAYSAKKTSNNQNLDNNADNEQKLQEQLKLNEGELNELEKELAENKTINEANYNKSNMNELDETANKILNSIPNAAAGFESNNLNNLSRISINSPSNQNLNAINITNHSNIAEQQIAAAAEEDEMQGKSKILTNEDLLINNNGETSKLILNSHLSSPNKEPNENPEADFNKENNFNNNENEVNTIPEKTEEEAKANVLSVFEKFKYDFSGSDYFFVDINEMLELKIQNFSISDFYSLLKKITEDYKQITIIISFPNIINNIGFLDLESINILNEIIGLTDIYIFDKKDALALFNLMAQINSEEDNYEDKKNLELLFIKEVKKKRKSHPKIGIFLDELKRATIIEQQTSSNLILFHTDYEFDLIPANVSKIVAEDYKKLFVVHYEMLKSVFIGGLFSRMLYKKPFNSGFTAGNESLKRLVELLRFNLDPPLDPNYFLIRIKKNNKMPDEEEKTKNKKEQHFTLDCSNIICSKMKEYNPLFDENLVSYFSSKYIRKHLKNLGFINKKGNILQDPDNKKLGIIESKKLNKVYEEEKVNLQRIKEKKEKLKLQIKNLLQGTNVMKTGNMKEIEKLTKVYNFYPQSDKKLPRINEFKRSINRNIKINTDIYLKEIQKGKGSRSKSHARSLGKTQTNNQTEAASVKNKNTLLDVIEKIEDKILSNNNNELSKISGSQKNNSQNASLRRDNNSVNNSKINNSNLNKSNVHNNNSKNNIMIKENSSNMNNSNVSGNNLIKNNTKSGKSQGSQKSKLENSSMNQDNIENKQEAEHDGKSGVNLVNNNNNYNNVIGEKDQGAKSISDENKDNNDNNDLDIKREVEGEEGNVSNDILNLEANENNKNIDAENKSINEINMNNVSKISKKIDVSGNDLNVSAKKSNLVSEENNNNVSKININTENEKNLLSENQVIINSVDNNNNDELSKVGEN